MSALNAATVPLVEPRSPTADAHAGAAVPRCRVARMAAQPPREGRERPRCNRAPARVAPPRRPLRGRPAPADAPASARRRARRHRNRSRRRCADERPPAPRRLSRRQPLHDLGLQVRAARGSGEAAETPWQGREVPLEPEGWSAILERRPRARRRSRAERAARDSAERDHRGSDAAPAARARGPRPERRPDRRPGRAAEHEPRRPLQDAARRAAKAARPPTTSVDSRSTTGGER